MEQEAILATAIPGRAAAVSPPAFADLARAHLDALYGYCLRLANHRPEAEDLLQETLLRAMKAFGTLRDPERGRAWLFTIATNAWRDWQRSLSRRPATVPLADGADEEFSLFTTIAIEDPFPYSDELHLDFLRLFSDEDMQSVFAVITPVHRLPLILTTIHGFSCKEAAAILGVPLGTLLSRLHRGRKQLERRLWDYAVERGLVKVSDDDDDD
ncbi:MAG: RNA polymerase sigma factor [Candidatus Limnocylindria bacterium]